MTLNELARWHRAQAKASTGDMADFHHAAVACLMDIIARKKAHRDAINTGLDRARKAGKTLGRPRVDPAIEKAVRRLLEKGQSIRAVAKETGAGHGTIQRIKSELTAE
jgi:DNA invertase Pin-like site-specific DNA recombinase